MFHVFTDGACKGNPGKGSWAFCVFDENDDMLGKKSGYSPETTNNEMEVTAVVELLRWATKSEGRPIKVYTDSAYVKNGMESWLWSWQKKGWKKADGQAPLNLELWKEAFTLLTQYKTFHGEIPTFIKVKGHSGDPRNDRVDALCNLVIEEHAFNDYLES